MVEKVPGSNSVAVAKDAQDTRVALTEGGIVIRREGKPVKSAAPRGGSVYLVIDCSSSMNGEKIAQAREGALEFAVEALTKGYAVGLISFSFDASLICEPRQDLSHFRRNVSSLEANGSTNMTDGIELATLKLRGKTNPLAMVIITDGVADDQSAALAAAGEAKKSGIDVITVGTEDADQEFLQKLATRSDLVVMVKSEQLGEGITSAAAMLTAGPTPSNMR